MKGIIMDTEKEKPMSEEFSKGINTSFRRLCKEQDWEYSDEFQIAFQNFISFIDIIPTEIIYDENGSPILRGKLATKPEETGD